MSRRLIVITLLSCCFAASVAGQASAGRSPVGVAAKPAVSALARYLRELDAVYTAPDDAQARTRARALLRADARYALGLRRALRGSDLAVASASERISRVTVSRRLLGGVEIAAVVDHSYALVSAEGRAVETTWEEAVSTHATIGDAGGVLEVTQLVQRTTTNVGAQQPDADSVAGQPDTVDDTADDTAADGVVPAPIGARRYPTSDSCGASAPDYCYFRSDAIAYVLAHACTTCHDPNWHYYRNEDCTNFMSAALYLRGNWLQQDYPTNYSTSWWWRSSTNHSRTWTIASKFFWYLAQRSRAVHASSLSRLIVGDLLQADWTGDGAMDHTAMVTKKDSTGIYLSYHSNDTRNKPWVAFKYGQPDAKYYGWNLQSVYDNRI